MLVLIGVFLMLIIPVFIMLDFEVFDYGWKIKYFGLDQYRITKREYSTGGVVSSTKYSIQRKVKYPFKAPRWLEYREIKGSWGGSYWDYPSFNTEEAAEARIQLLLSGKLVNGTTETVVKYIP